MNNDIRDKVVIKNPMIKNTNPNGGNINQVIKSPTIMLMIPISANHFRVGRVAKSFRNDSVLLIINSAYFAIAHFNSFIIDLPKIAYIVNAKEKLILKVKQWGYVDI
jgi:hypothetical protein